MAFRCGVCGFELFVPIVEGADTAVGLYDDRRFPGRCIVVLKAHAEHLDEVPPASRDALLERSTDVGRVLRAVCGSDRVNYAVLGNVHSHVHVHVIPRGGPHDVNPGRPPWENPLPAERLEPDELHRLVSALRTALSTAP